MRGPGGSGDRRGEEGRRFTLCQGCRRGETMLVLHRCWDFAEEEEEGA